jgi:hypothetical protein
MVSLTVTEIGLQNAQIQPRAKAKFSSGRLIMPRPQSFIGFEPAMKKGRPEPPFHYQFIIDCKPSQLSRIG